MGGLLFSFPRLPRAEYLEREAEVRAALDAVWPAVNGEAQWQIPLYHADKADFGDLDVLVREDALTEAALAEFGERLGITQTRRVKGIFSHAYRQMQLDLMATPPTEVRTRFEFMSWGDLGNLLGRMMRPLGLKWGESGLLYVYRRPGQAHYVRTFTVSLSIDEVMRAAELDPAPWHRGFVSEQEMFGWVMGAGRFSARPYLLPEGDFGRRLTERAGLGRFVDFVKAQGLRAEEMPPRPTPPPEAEQLETLLHLFPASGLTDFLAEEGQRLERDRLRHSKFSGRRVMELRPEVQGRELGRLMQALTAAPGFWEWVDTATPEAIEAHILEQRTEGGSGKS